MCHTLYYNKLERKNVKIIRKIFTVTIPIYWKTFVYWLCRNAFASPLLIKLFFFLSCRSSLSILDINPLSDNVICKYFFPLHGLPFHSADCPLMHRTFHFWCTPIYQFFLMLPLLWCHWGSHYQIQCQWSFLPIFYFRSFSFRSYI